MLVPVSTAGLEEVPHQHGREHVDDEVGDAVGQEVGEQDVEDGQGEGRVEHRPQEPEDRVLVLDLDLLAHQEDEQLAGPPQLTQAQPDAHPGGDHPGGLGAPGRERARLADLAVLVLIGTVTPATSTSASPSASEPVGSTTAGSAAVSDWTSVIGSLRSDPRAPCSAGGRLRGGVLDHAGR